MRRKVAQLLLAVSLVASIAGCTSMPDPTLEPSATETAIPTPVPTPRVENTVTPTPTASAVPTATSTPPPPTPPAEPAGPVAVAISARGGQFCAVSDEERIVCWGNGFSQLPELSDPVPGVREIAVTESFACLLNSQGGVECWGNNYQGQLGDGSTDQRQEPVDVIGLESGVQSIAVGQTHSCAVVAAGDVMCWGSNNGYALGLGADSTVAQSSVPVQVQALNAKARSVAIGDEQTCVITESGGVKCWGRNRDGGLGDGSRNDRANPVDVTGLSEGVESITSAGGGTCALMTDGRVMCWGRGSGYPGTGAALPTPTPVIPSGQPAGPTPTPIPGDSSVPFEAGWISGPAVSISKAWYHTCAVLESGAIECWGEAGRLGGGPLSATSLEDPTVHVVGIGNGATFVAAGGRDTCAIVAKGGIKCWGEGFGDFNVPVDIAPFLGVAADIRITQSTSHKIPVVGRELTYSVEVDNAGPKSAEDVVLVIQQSKNDSYHSKTEEDVRIVKIEGVESECDLGVDSQRSDLTVCPLGSIPAGTSKVVEISVTPGSAGNYGSNVAIAFAQSDPDTRDNMSGLDSEVVFDAGSLNVAKVAVGPSHTCLALTDGGLKCWGYNDDGQVGDGTRNERLVAVDVKGFSGRARNVAVGLAHSCALNDAGEVFCWGRNNHGQLGDGSTEQSLVPVKVAGLGSDVRAIAAAGGTSCAITSNAGVKCWGANATGQLGDGSTSPRTRPVDVSGLGSGIVEISLSASSNSSDDAGHSCALTTVDRVVCWGDNTGGRLGDGTDVMRMSPVDVTGIGSGIRGIAAGSAHTCAIKGDGAVMCWGARSLGDGRGGVGGFVPVTTATATPLPFPNPTPTPNPTAVPAATATPGGGATGANFTPVNVDNLPGAVRAIAASTFPGGGDHTCATLESGAVWCWGQGAAGLVEGSDNSVASKVDGLDSGFHSISIGSRNQCVINLSGRLKCWGWSSRIGDGTDAQAIKPVDIPGADLRLAVDELRGVAEPDEQLIYDLEIANYGPGASSGFTATYELPAGVAPNSVESEDATCTVALNSLVCDFNELLVADTATARIILDAVSIGEFSSVVTIEPNETDRFAVTNAASIRTVIVEHTRRDAAAIALGNLHSCAIEVGGDVYCWGRNRYGQVGAGTKSEAVLPVRVSGLAGPAIAIAAGGDHTCALLESGAIQCWGRGRNGQLGDGSSEDRSIPVDVTGLEEPATRIFARGNRTCAEMADTTILCWGRGNQTNSAKPERVDLLDEPVLAFSPSARYTCVVTEQGAAKCWGNNDYGQLGDGTNEASDTPVTVLGLSRGMRDIAVGADQGYTCAVTDTGGVKCWGHNSYGRLGDGTEESRLVPVDVLGISEPVSSVVTGNGASCALTDRGGVYCWGFWLVPYDEGVDNRIAQPVAGLESGVVAISTGLVHVCALMDDGGIKCFGSPDDGKLGQGSARPPSGNSPPLGVIGFMPDGERSS